MKFLLGLDRKDTKIVENSGKSSARFDHLALDRTEFDQLRRLSAVLLIEKSLARCSGDHLALDRVEFDQLTYRDMLRRSPLCGSLDRKIVSALFGRSLGSGSRLSIVSAAARPLK